MGPLVPVTINAFPVVKEDIVVTSRIVTSVMQKENVGLAAKRIETWNMKMVLESLDLFAKTNGAMPRFQINAAFVQIIEDKIPSLLHVEIVLVSLSR